MCEDGTRTFSTAAGATHSFTITQPVISGVGAWVDDLPSIAAIDARREVAELPDADERLARAAQSTFRPRTADERRDQRAAQLDTWLAELHARELTDLVIPINHGHEPPYQAKAALAEDHWRRLQFLVTQLTSRRYADGFPWSPSVHLMAFCGVDLGFIAACAASLIDACARVPDISSVMIDCEEWWVGGAHHNRPRRVRERAAAEVQTRLYDGWPGTRPSQGIGVTGLAAGPPDELLAFLDYGVPQIYGSERNMGGASLAAARTAHRRFYRMWMTGFGDTRPVDACRIIVGHTANADYVDAGRMRLLAHAALDIGGSGDPPLTYPDTVFYWSTNHLTGARGAEALRLAHLARNGGVRISDVA